MKIAHMTAAAALLTNSILAFPAFAAIVGTATVDDPTAQALTAASLVLAQDQCDALAAAHAPLVYSGTLDESSVTPTGLVSSPTEIDPTQRVKSNIEGTGTFIPGHTYIQGDPFRIGGSVNLFGDQYADSGSWTDSEYDFTNDFTSTFSYSFTCKMVETVMLPATGHHEWTHDPSDPEAQACLAYDKNGLFQGEDQGQCVWIADSPGGPDPQDRPDEFGTINQDQTDNLAGHENHGGPVQAPGGVFHIGQVVICISPSSSTKKGVPGAWRAQNGYSGGSFTGAGTPPAAGCNTPYFKVAPWGAGTDTSNGTYISVPDYTF